MMSSLALSPRATRGPLTLRSSWTLLTGYSVRLIITDPSYQSVVFDMQSARSWVVITAPCCTSWVNTTRFALLQSFEVLLGGRPEHEIWEGDWCDLIYLYCIISSSGSIHSWVPACDPSRVSSWCVCVTRWARKSLWEDVKYEHRHIISAWTHWRAEWRRPNFKYNSTFFSSSLENQDLSRQSSSFLVMYPYLIDSWPYTSIVYDPQTILIRSLSTVPWSALSPCFEELRTVIRRCSAPG